MQIEPPLIAHTYVSGTDPTLVVYVTKVGVFEAGEEDGILFSVACCDPAYKDDVWNADGFEMTSEVWDKHRFTLVAQ